MNSILIPLAGSVDLSGQWSKLWNLIKGVTGIGSWLDFFGLLGLACIIFALIRMFWSNYRHNTPLKDGAKQASVLGSIIVGMIFAAPTIIIPLLLNLVDIVANAIIKIFNR